MFFFVVVMALSLDSAFGARMLQDLSLDTGLDGYEQIHQLLQERSKVINPNDRFIEIGRLVPTRPNPTESPLPPLARFENTNEIVSQRLDSIHHRSQQQVRFRNTDKLSPANS